MEKEARKKTIILLGAVFFLAMIFNVIVITSPKTEKGEFIPPDFEKNAVLGQPRVPEELGYSSPYRDGMAYKFSICGKPETEGNLLTVFFTNPRENKAWLKLRVYSTAGEMLAESGLLKEGEYLEKITLTTSPPEGEKLIFKVMGYQPDSYVSIGAVTLNVSV